MIYGEIQPIQRVVKFEEENSNRTNMVTDIGKAGDAVKSEVEGQGSDNTNIITEIDETTAAATLRVEEASSETERV